MIRNVIILLFVVFSLSAEAQLVNRRTRTLDRTPGTTTAQKLPEFNVEKAVGLTIYEMERVAKKLGLKKSSETLTKVTSIINKFNKSQKELARINSFSFSQAKTKIEAAQKEVLKTREYAVLEKAYKEVSEGFKPISKQIEEKEKTLDESLKSVLSEKQFKKWKKLKDRIKRKG